MVNFARLPTETLQRIWSLVPTDDIMSLAAVCETIRYAGKEYITKHRERQQKYSLMRKTLGVEDRLTTFVGSPYDLSPPPPLFTIFRDICKEPVIAEYVKEVVIDSCSVSWGDNRPTKRKLWTLGYGGVLASIMHSCQYLSCREEAGGMTEEARRCIRSIEEGNEDVPIGLLLALLPRIRSLRFRCTPAVPAFCVRVISRIARDSTATALSQLTKVEIDFNYGAHNSEQPLAMLVAFAALPSLTSLSARNMGQVTHDNLEKPSTNTSRVTELTLDRISIDATSLFTFLAIFKALKKFTYESLDPRKLRRPNFSPKEIISSLLRCAKESLTHLTLYSHYSERTWMGSLGAFTVLSHLHTDWGLLLDARNAWEQQLVENLPPTVQELHLNVNVEPPQQSHLKAKGEPPTVQEFHLNATVEPFFDVDVASILIDRLVLAKRRRFPVLVDFLLLHMTGKNTTALMRRPCIRTAAKDGLIIRCDTTVDPDHVQLEWYYMTVRQFVPVNPLETHLSRLLESPE